MRVTDDSSLQVNNNYTQTGYDSSANQILVIPRL